MSYDVVKIAIADDHPLFRTALIQAAAKTLSHSEILEAESFAELQQLLNHHDDLELIFLDINMPGNDGFSGLSRIKNAYPDIQVIMVSAIEDGKVIGRAIDLGASGYIPKSSSLEQISRAIETVLNGETWVPEGILVVENDGPEKVLAAKLETLTPAQFNVLQMICDGLLNKQIAYEMNIQETTVKNHVSAILQKLSVNNRTQAGLIYQQLKSIEQQSESLL
ncbi:response regulator transcription factor [Thalassotalea mangrovi]|uniref:Response regulator transcription factor n=1 Tax=Thalassotalea mangrovi TaxID=2572245 RepID=A0A4V5NUR9_9GAMM|nr:response regulator transcription factor [Thalassotalea mangrovi]TKB47522.1 response regulator transcription factor [Thalassotalea mangrovi]